jgi:hypothetical protein
MARRSYGGDASSTTYRILWEFKLPSNQEGNPMTYMLKNR